MSRQPLPAVSLPKSIWAVVFVALLLLTACSFEASIGGGIDVGPVEDSIVEAGNEQRPDLAPWEAECDTDLESLSEGDQFFCTAIAADGSEFEVTVTATDDEGNVDIQF